MKSQTLDEQNSTIEEKIVLPIANNRNQIKSLPIYKVKNFDHLIIDSKSSRAVTTRAEFEIFRTNSALQPSGKSLQPLKHLEISASAKQELEILKDYIFVFFKSRLETVNLYKDQYPLLDFRKALLSLRYSLSELCLLIIKTKIFEVVVILVILMNTAVLAFEDPSSQNDSFSGIEYFFLYFYTAECLLKIMALGFMVHEGSYLRDKWNVMDFIIIISAWVSIYGGSNIKLSSLRMLRILRPLRSISSIKGMRNLFLALFKSYKQLLFSLVILFVFVFIFAIIALQLWGGTLTMRCLYEDGTFLNNVPCGVDSCPTNYVCAQGLDNPNFGTVNFDNIIISMVMVFQILTLEGWSTTLEWTQRAFSYYSVFFYIPCIFLGSYLIINLTLAIITISFTQAVNSSADQPKEEFSLDYLDEEISESPESFKKISKNNLLEEQKTLRESTKNKLKKLKFKKIQGLRHQEVKSTQTIEADECKSEYNQTLIRQVNRDHFESPIFSDSIQANSEVQESENLKLMEPVFSIKSPEKLPETYKKDSSFNTPLSKSTIKRIKSVLTVRKVGFGMTRKKIDSSFSLGINESYSLSSSSSSDVIPSDAIVKYCRSYSFKYSTEEANIKNVKTLEKYQKFKEFEIISLLKNMYPGKKSFYYFFYPAKAFVKDIGTQDSFNMEIKGNWSGNDVKPDGGELRESIQYMTYKLWRNTVLEKSMFIIRKIVINRHFINLITAVIIVNTIVLAIDHYGISPSESATLSSLNVFFTYFFAGEIALRIYGLGPRRFIRDSMNFFDLSVVILSLIELSILTSGSSTFSAFRAIRVFRIFRVLRVVRLLRYLRSISHIVRAISKSLTSFIYLFLLLILFLIIFTLIGMQIFGGTFNFLKGLPRGNFDSFHWAFVTTFQLLSTENWNDILTSSLRSSAAIEGTVFLISWVILGNFILLNLFLAILIQSFSTDKEEEMTESAVERVIAIAKRKFGTSIRKLEELEGMNTSILESFALDNNNRKSVNKVLENDIFCEKSYFLFNKNSSFRKLCFKIVTHPRFDTFSLVIIIISSVKLVWDTYLLDMDSTNTQKQVSDYLDYCFTFIFSLEFVIKSTSHGLVLSKNTYLRDNWNKIDFCIIIVSIIDSSVSSFNLPIIKLFRLLRCIRPIKLISHNLSMKIVVIALIESIRAILNVCVVILIIWIVFAILGVSLLGGKMYCCSNPALRTQDLCLSSGYNWVNTNANFDNVFDAMATLFIVMSQESWPNRMFEGVDARDIGVCPSVNSNPAMAYYYISYFVIGNFFLVNLFTAVVFDKFTEAKKDQSTMAALLLTKEQMIWSELQKMLLESSIVVDTNLVPTNLLRRFLFKVVKSKAFEFGMILIIFMNMVAMAMPYEQASSEYNDSLETINIVFTFVFFIEALLKILALGVRTYFKSNWNRFDFVVVLFSALDFILEISIGNKIQYLRSFPQLMRVLRVVRIGRVLRIVNNFKSLQNIIMTITYALPAIINILSLMVLIFFIFAVLGSFLFHNVKGQLAISSYFNFSNFGYSMVILWRISTGEDYPSIMYDCSNSLGSKFYYIYFIVFITLIDFIILELFVSVIIQNYEEQTGNQESPLQIFSKEQKRFRKIWGTHSSNYSGYRLDKENLIRFLSEYGPGAELIRENPSRIELIMLINSLDIRTLGSFFYYHDVLFSILKRKYGKFRTKQPLNIYSQKLIRINEVKANKKLDHIRERSRREFNDRMEQMTTRNDFFFKIMLTRSIFRNWKKYTQGRKSRRSLISITPEFSDVEYPGDVSLVM